MNELTEIDVIKLFTDILDELNILYAIGGSIASSIYGRVRFTQDADITVASLDDKTERFYNLTRQHFYISKSAMHQAVRSKTSFNVIHTQTAFKIDVFIAQDSEFDKSFLRRAQKIKLSEDIEKTFSVVTAEDIILLKLMWYKQAECSSEKQWSDLLGVLIGQRDALDFDYIKSWSKKLQIDALLNKAIKDSKIL